MGTNGEMWGEMGNGTGGLPLEPAVPPAVNSNIP